MLEKPRIIEERRVSCLRRVRFRGWPRTPTTSQLRDRSEMIGGLTYINEVCEKRYLSQQIDSVCEEHSASKFGETLRSYGLVPENFKPTDVCSTWYQKMKILGEMYEYG